MPHLPQAAVSRVGHQGMAHHPCSRVPSVARLVDPEEVDVPVEVGLQVPGRHPREAPKVALEPGAQTVHRLRPFQVDLVVEVGPLGPGHYPAAHGLPHARRAGFPVASDARDGVLVDIDGAQMQSFWQDRAGRAWGLPVAL